MAGVPKRVENLLKEGFGDTRHLSIGLRGFGMLEIIQRKFSACSVFVLDLRF